MSLLSRISGYDIFISKVDEINDSFPTGLVLRIFGDRDILKNGSLVDESDSVIAICNREGNIPHRDATFFIREEEEIINIYGFYLNFVSECFDKEVLEEILKKLKKTFGKDIYISKDSISLKEDNELSSKSIYHQEFFSILDNITGINKISEIGWVY
jgi:hypothetical protein